MTLRPLGQIAQDICDDYRAKSLATRKPMPPLVNAYVRPLVSLTTMDDTYGLDDAETLVIYALSNLNHYRGPNSKRLKDELKMHLYQHNPSRYRMPK